MRLEAVTICIGYADFLDRTARCNRGLFDEWIVVTAADDKDTRDVCHLYSIKTVLTEEHKREDADFAKGRAVEKGLRMLSADCWHLHLDADIALPSNARNILESAWLQEDKVYGCDRVLVKSYADWQRLKATGWLERQQSNHCYVNFPKGFEIGTRWVSAQTGYVPIGFFQLAHQSLTEQHGIRQYGYPVRHGNACRTDIKYALQWDRHKRELLPELIVAHLESENSPIGKNWNGRKSGPFGPVTSGPPSMPDNGKNY